MAKAYRTKVDLAVPIVIGRDDDQEVTSGEAFVAGSLIREDQLSKYHREQIEQGNLDDLFEPVSDEEAEDAQRHPNVGGEPERGIFFPEHEAERVALQVAGHLTVPKEQELEVLSAGEQHSDEHMARVREAGLDQRPVQEHMAQAEQRIPDHILTGSETAAGMPHNRGPAEMEYAADQHEGDPPAARPRPSIAPREEAESQQENEQVNQGEGESQEGQS